MDDHNILHYFHRSHSLTLVMDIVYSKALHLGSTVSRARKGLAGYILEGFILVNVITFC